MTMLAARITVGLVNVGIVALVARALGPAGQGRVAVGLTTLLVAVQLGNFGLSSATTVWSSGDRDVLPRVLTIVLWWAASIGLPLGAAITLIALGTGALSIEGGDAAVIAVATPVVLGASLLQGVLLGRGRAREMNTAEAGAGVAALAVVTLVLFGLDAGPTAALAAALSQYLLATLAYLFLIREDLPRSVRVDGELARRMFRFSRTPFAAAVLGFLLIRSDLLLVDAVLGPDEAGRYAVAVTLSQAVYLFPLSVGINLLPRAARGRSVRETARVLRVVLPPYALMCGALAALAGPVIEIGFGSEYAESARLLRLLLPGTFALGAVAIVSYYFAASGYPWAAVWAWAGALVLNVVANLVLLPSLGLDVAPIASTVTYALLAVIVGAIFWRTREPQRPAT